MISVSEQEALGPLTYVVTFSKSKILPRASFSFAKKRESQTFSVEELPSFMRNIIIPTVQSDPQRFFIKGERPRKLFSFKKQSNLNTHENMVKEILNAGVTVTVIDRFPEERTTITTK